jgi:hypothetical protein
MFIRESASGTWPGGSISGGGSAVYGIILRRGEVGKRMGSVETRIRDTELRTFHQTAGALI